MPAFVVCLVQATSACAQGTTRTQTFNSNPGWSTLNSGVQGNNFGFSNSANAGGTAGEAGGTFTRSDTFRYYADTNLGGSLTLNQPITASGLFNCTAANTPDFVNGLFIGHFASASDSYAIGIFFSNGGSDSSKLAWGINVRGDGNNILTTQTTIDANIARTWSYSWNPTGGVNGLGELSATLSGPGGGTKIVDMPSGTQVRTDASFDSFGLMGTNVNATASASDFADIYIDNVTYTIVPEPVLILPLMVAILFFRRII